MPKVSYCIGDTVIQYCFGSKKLARTVKITAQYADIKAGRPGFYGITTQEGFTFEVWGFDTEVMQVTEAAHD